MGTGGGSAFVQSTPALDGEPRANVEPAGDRLFRELVEGAPEGILVQIEGRFEYANPACARLFGASCADELIGQLVMGYVAPESRDAIAERIRAMREEQSPQPASEVQLLRPDGTVVPAEASAVPWSRDGRRGALVFVRDISERKRIEESLRRSEGRLRLAADMTGLGLWDWWPTGGAGWWDQRSREIFWVPLDEPIDTTVFERCLDPDDLDRVREGLAKSVNLPGGRQHTLEFRVVGPDGQRRWVQGSWMVIRDHGVAVRMIGTTIDITERKESEERLLQLLHAIEEADRRKTEFLGVLSHELRNPLAPIRNSLAVLERATPGGEQARRAQAVIDRQVGLLTRLIDDLLDVTRIARGKIQLHREHVELGEIVRRTLDDLDTEFQTRGIGVESQLRPEPLWIHADPSRIAQVIGNLLGNAAKFTPRGGKVVVSLGREAGAAILRVRDDGVGLAPETIQHLFKPFSQAPQSLARSQGGLGLGLALVKGLVELHGGAVHATSEGIGKGAEFTVKLPLSAEAVSAPPPAKPSAPRHRRVLIIEDSVDAAVSLKDLLELEGHEVQVAYDGRSGLALASSYHPDIVLCDIGLPGMNGYDVARAIRRDDDLKTTTLVALTGYALPEDRIRATEAGFTHHLAKPPSIDALSQIIAAAE